MPGEGTGGAAEGVDAGNAGNARSTSPEIKNLSPPTPPAPPPKQDADGNCGSGGSAKQKPSNDKKKRVVSFAANVQTRDGSLLQVTEEHGVILGPLLGKIVMSADSSSASQASLSSINSDHLDDASHTSTSSGPLLTFAEDDLTSEKLAESDSSTGLVKRGPLPEGESSESGVRYENMIVKMGLLKCGSRYKVSVPIPQYWKGETEARMIEGSSLDEDLTGEITPGTDADGRGHAITIKLGARKRGPYRGRLLLELTLRAPRLGRDDSHPTVASRQSHLTPCPADRVLMSLQIDATLMGNDLGTPKLRNGVSCLGKIVGYDSEEETEWQGFDSDD
mmetsp:Transcript_29187/g.69494  ORF Transcript_29187/g.69494 Transcript_29187/m.69494 type:complete len:335 (+) Transcript_29187:96-1100(+)